MERPVNQAELDVEKPAGSRLDNFSPYCQLFLKVCILLNAAVFQSKTREHVGYYMLHMVQAAEISWQVSFNPFSIAEKFLLMEI